MCSESLVRCKFHPLLASGAGTARPRRSGAFVGLVLLLLLPCLSGQAQMPPMGDFSGYERIDRTQVLALLSAATAHAPADLSSKNLSGLGTWPASTSNTPI